MTDLQVYHVRAQPAKLVLIFLAGEESYGMEQNKYTHTSLIWGDSLLRRCGSWGPGGHTE